MQLNPGTTLQGGKFRIIKVLGQGGFGITYLAENTFLQRRFAIKEFFPKDFCSRTSTNSITLGTENNRSLTEKLKARFLKEAKNIAQLDHPGIVRIHELFEENDTAYYVMDYVEGRSLAEIVKHGGRLEENEALNYIAKVGNALDYIHSEQMTHFDIKPANIMVRKKDGEPVLIDFGLSKQYSQEGSATSTVLQAVSHGYSAIELYKAGTMQSFSPETDVYSLGATLYKLLTGETPPDASTIATEDYDVFGCIPEKYRDTIRRAMSVKRQNRFHSASEFNRALKDAMEIDKSQQTKSSKDTTVILGPSGVDNSDKRDHDTKSKNPKWSRMRLSRKKMTTGIFILGIVGILAIIILFIIHVNSDTESKLDAVRTANSARLDSIVQAEIAASAVKEDSVVKAVAEEIQIEEPKTEVVLATSEKAKYNSNKTPKVTSERAPTSKPNYEKPKDTSPPKPAPAPVTVEKATEDAVEKGKEAASKLKDKLKNK